MIDLADAGCVLGGRTVWAGVSTRVGPGEFVAILGPNGVGKSTLLKVLLGLVPLAHGTARVLGRPPGAANREIGYLPQRGGFDATVRVPGSDIVRLGVDGHRWGVPLPGRRSRAAAERTAAVVHRVGAAGYAHRPIGTLSGGEQQRLLIGQALAAGPRLLLLDEPLDSLDLPNQAAIAALVRDICADGVAVVMVAHDVNPILPYLDRVVYLAGGGAVVGTPDEVITTEALSKLYATPVEVLSTSDGQLVVVGVPEPVAHHGPRHAPAPGIRR